MNDEHPDDLPAIYRASMARWGEEAQYDQAVEECAELITALKHYKRRRIGAEELADELADVALMIGQLAWMLGEDRVAAARRRKLEKLRGLLAVDEAESAGDG